jgi:signal transduction histidine kinase
MPQQCSPLQASLSVQQLRSENEELRRYLDAQKKVISSLERRVGRSLDSLGGQVQQLLYPSSIELEQQSWINLIQHEVSSLSDLLADAMLLQKFEAGKVDVVLESLSLTHTLLSVSRHLVKDGGSNRLICEFEPDLPLVEADQELLEAVLIDLLARGLRYSDPDCPVVLGVRQEGLQVYLYITAQRFAPVGNRDFATEIVLCCRRIEVQNGTVTCQQGSDGLQTVRLTLNLAMSASVAG